MVSLALIPSTLLSHMVISCHVRVHPDVWISTISREHLLVECASVNLSVHCFTKRPAANSCSTWRCLTGFEGVVKLMFIISANQLNMFREGSALPSSVHSRFMGSFEFSQVAATSHRLTMETKRGRRS